MNNDLNQNLNNNITPQPMPNTEPVNPQPIPNPVQEPVAQPMNQGMVPPQEPVAQPMNVNMVNPMPEQSINPQQMNMGAQVQNPMPDQQPQPTITPMENQAPEQPAAPEKPPKQKSNPVLIVLMFVALIGGAIYFGYNYFFANKTTKSNNTNSGTTVTDNTNEEMQNDEVTDYESIAKEKVPTILSLANQKNGAYTYCGASENSDLTKDAFSYRVSTKYKTIDELKKFLNTIMTTDVLNKYFATDTNSYIEQDGKLYCSYVASGKDLSVFSTEENITKQNILKYNVENKEEDSFEVKTSYTLGEINQEYKASFVKENNNWIIKNFE